MTSYSLYGTNHIKFVDGDLSPDDDERAADDLDSITNCVAAGAMRSLLNSTRDLADEDAEVYAEQWHSADEGWELDALHDGDVAAFMEYITRFTRENLANILSLARYLAWEDERGSGDRSLWFHDTGMAIYRVGELLGFEGAGAGVSLDDYDKPVSLDSGDYDAAIRLADDGVPVMREGRRYRHTPGGRMALWVAQAQTNAAYVWEQTWIDSTEEPSRLHLSA